MIERTAIVELARSYLGTPFHHQGRLPGAGLDCIGILACIAAAFSIPHVDRAAYDRRGDGKALLEGLRSGMDEIAIADALPGDAFAFELKKKGAPQHVGLVTDVGVLHSTSKIGRVVEHRLDERWRARIHSAWRFRGVV